MEDANLKEIPPQLPLSSHDVIARFAPLKEFKLKEKRRQTFLKTTTEGRIHAKQKRFEEELLKEKHIQEEEEKRLENPELYLENLRSKYKELYEKLEQRKKLKTNGNRSNNNQNNSGNVGRGERLNAAQRERMRLLTTAAFDRGKGEDTFGARDEDWQLYKKMSKDVDEDVDDQDEDEAEFTRVSSRLQDIDPEFSSGASLYAGIPDLFKKPVTPQDFQIQLGVERFRCPEILFQPNMVGIDQAGLDEMVGTALRRLSSYSNLVDEEAKTRMCTSILLTGGSTLFPGLNSRLESGIRRIRPYLSPLKVIKASDPILDAWRGAANYASGAGFLSQTFSIQDYYERGEDALRDYKIKYCL